MYIYKKTKDITQLKIQKIIWRSELCLVNFSNDINEIIYTYFFMDIS